MSCSAVAVGVVQLPYLYNNDMSCSSFANGTVVSGDGSTRHQTFSSFHSDSKKWSRQIVISAYQCLSMSQGKLLEAERRSLYIQRFLYLPLHCFPKEDQ